MSVGCAIEVGGWTALSESDPEVAGEESDPGAGSCGPVGGGCGAGEATEKVILGRVEGAAVTMGGGSLSESEVQPGEGDGGFVGRGC